MSELHIGASPPPSKVKVYRYRGNEPIAEVEFNGRICPFCARAGQKSRLSEHGGSTTLLSCNPFYDEEGKRHYHDSNNWKNDYSCSNGHRFTHSTYPGRCTSCDWKPSWEEESIRVGDDLVV